MLTTCASRAEGCPKPSETIETDRPDQTNSSIVVPVGSFQSENGTNLTGKSGGRTLDGTNSRWRLGIAPCLEVLVDLPNYVGTMKTPGASGFSDVAPAIKWQISPVPGTFDLSVVAGIALPTGASDVAGRGSQPYVQLPWSRELRDGWALSGMFTEFFRPNDATKRITEATFVIEKKVTDKVSVFTEYVGDYPEGNGPSHLLNSGVLYRLSRLQQVDFHIAAGLNRNAPNYIIGVGYSFRVDGLFH